MANDRKSLHFATLSFIVDEKGDIGKTKLQKIVYFLQNTFGVPLDYSFKIHYYGTYAEELDNDLTDMSLQGYITIRPDLQGYGYHLRSGDQEVENADELLSPFMEKMRRCLAAFGQFDATQLELFSALHFVRERLEEAEKAQTVDRVKVLKPKFSREDIETAYNDLERLIT